MPNAKDIKQNEFPSILLIGESGTHKTWFIGTCPRPVLYDFDGTLRVLRGKDVNYWRFKDAPQGSKLINPERGVYPWGTAWVEFLKHLNETGRTIDDPSKRAFDTIGTDSLSSLGNIALNYVLKETNYIVTARSPVDRGLWGFQAGLLQMVVEQLNSWPVIKVMTAHVQRDANDITGNTEKLPLTTGKFAAKISSLYDEVYYTETQGAGDKQQFVLRTNQDGVMKHAKSPCGVPDRVSVDWAAISKYVMA